jgi:formylglycine-generating enzyme required for sulfatase activity/serine/threonine protein kinase
MMPPPRDEHFDEDSLPDPGPPTEPNVAPEDAPTLTHEPNPAHLLGQTVPLPGPAGTAGGTLPRQFGRYHIEKTLGYGGMGSVYLAQDTQLHRQVALKVPFINETNAPRVLARFRREAQSAATLVHPNICPVYDVGEIDGIHYLTMAFIEGRPLHTMIPVAKGIDPLQAADYAYRIALALEEAHQKGIIHRDLKPSNVMINNRGEPVIMDFGLAYLNLDEDADGRLTQSGVPLGTPCYMDPEQLSGDTDSVKPARDIYSLGVLLYEMLTGRLPFTGKTVHQILARAMVEEPVPPRKYRPELDEKLEAICLRAMAKRSTDRFPTMAAVAEALEPIVWSVPTHRGRPRPMSSMTMPSYEPPKETTPEELPSQWPTMDFDRPPRPAAAKPSAEAPSTTPARSRSVTGALAGILVVALVGVGIAIVNKSRQKGPEEDPSIVDPAPVVVNPPPVGEERGTIALRFSDPAAEVAVYVDRAPVSAQSPLHLAVGSHHLRIIGEDIDTVDQEFTVREGANPDLQIPLTTYGSIRLLPADPGSGVTARLDGKPIDPALLAQSRRLATGSHHLRLDGKDITPVERKFDVRRGSNPDLPIAFDLFGTVRLMGDVLDADGTIKLDGRVLTREAAKEPLRLNVGVHKLEITGAYFEPIEQAMRIVRGENPPVKLATTYFGDLTLSLKPEVKDVELEVDEKPVSSFQPGKPLRLSIGKHHFRLTAAGFHPRELDVILKRGPNPPRVIALEQFDPIAVKAKKFKNSLDMDLVRIEAGTVHMGSPSEQVGHRDNEEPRTEKIKTFYMGAHEVTVGAFRVFVQKATYRTDAERSRKGAWRFDADKKKLVQDPQCTWEHPGWKQAEDEPVVCVTWHDAQAFCDWLSKQERRKYRLPTEAEWEYACRAGGSTAFHFGDSLDATQANFDGSRPYGKGDKGPARNRTLRVGTFKPNEWGLYDMHGNVWEWCADTYRKTPSSPPRAIVERVIRGGSWFDPAVLCRSAYRSFDEPNLCSPNLGFRIVCEAVEKPKENR